MKTSVELRKLYKEETGEPFCNIEYSLNEVADDLGDWDALTIENYIMWLEEKVEKTLKR